MQTNSPLVIFALIAALGLVSVVAVDVILTIQEVDAAPRPTKGCNRSIAFNASEGRCFQGPRDAAELTVEDEEQTRDDEPTVEEQVEEDEDEEDEDEEDDEDENNE
jgi:hypothetical protein